MRHEQCVTHYACPCLLERLKRLGEVAEAAKKFVRLNDELNSFLDSQEIPYAPGQAEDVWEAWAEFRRVLDALEEV